MSEWNANSSGLVVNGHEEFAMVVCFIEHKNILTLIGWLS